MVHKLPGLNTTADSWCICPTAIYSLAQRPHTVTAVSSLGQRPDTYTAVSR